MRQRHVVLLALLVLVLTAAFGSCGDGVTEPPAEIDNLTGCNLWCGEFATDETDTLACQEVCLARHGAEP